MSGPVGFHRGAPGPSFWLMAAAVALLLPVYANPSRSVPGPTYEYLFVIDISESMNVRDQGLDDRRLAGSAEAGLSSSRIEAAKRAVALGLRRLPCGSRAALGLFADRETVMIFEPLEICEHYPAIERVVKSVDWTWAWAGNSQIDGGVVTAIEEAAARKLRLVFFTDGDQAPHRDAIRLDKLKARRGSAEGLLIGVGGEQERPVPKIDPDGEITGYWGPVDAIRNGFNPNMSTLLDGLEGGATLDITVPLEHLSALRDDRLREIARVGGLQYLLLEDDTRYLRALLQPGFARFDQTPSDLRPVFAFLAMLLLLSAWLLPDTGTQRLPGARGLGQFWPRPWHRAVYRPAQSAAGLSRRR